MLYVNIRSCLLLTAVSKLKGETCTESPGRLIVVTGDEVYQGSSCPDQGQKALGKGIVASG